MSTPSQTRLQSLSDAYQTLQSDLQALIPSRQKLESQQAENRSVEKELSSLPSDSGIYKLVGPVLVKQERGEAELAVKARLEFIEKDIRRVEGRIGEMEVEGEGMKMEVFQLQSKMQQSQG